MQPKKHFAIFLIPGLCSYEGEGNGVWLFQKAAIDNSIGSFIGKPVQIGHNEGSPAVGYVYVVKFDEYLGAYIADFFLLDEQAEGMVSSGDYFPSCGYTVEEQGEGGVYNELEYSLEVLKARFDHLAIVDSPRYSCGVFDFYNTNTPNSEDKPKLELKAINSGGRMASKKKTANNESGTEEEKKDEAAQAENSSTEGETTATNSTEGESVLDKVVITPDGEMPINELVEKYKKIVADNAKRIIDENESLDIDGKSVTVKEMIETVFGSSKEEEPVAEEPPPPPAENEGDEDDEEDEEQPPAATNSKTKTATNGVEKMKKAATAANSAPTINNSRLPNESRNAFNERMTKQIFLGG